MTALRSSAAIFLAAGLLLPPAGGASAQPAKAAPAKAAQPAAPVPEAARPSNAPFLPPLGRLATILGSMHFLRELCGDPNANLWRDRMTALLDAQNPSAPDREALTANFNGGYRSFASVYRRCSPAARAAAERYRAEGATLSRDIAMRFGN